MDNTEQKTCKSCNADIHPLEEFPGCICLNCHAAKWDSSNKQEQWNQMMATFSGAGINKQGVK